MKTVFGEKNQIVYRWIAGSFSLLTLLMFVDPVLAQNYIVQPTTPLGGYTAAPLNSSDSIQRKLGSLVIGSSTTTSYLCLNTDLPFDGTNQDCISGWAGLRNTYVKLHTNQISGINTDLASYEPADPGYARIRADNSPTKQQLFTLIAEVPSPATPGAAAIIATNGGNANNFAGYFSGTLAIVKDTSNNNGRLCLNSTTYPVITSGPDTGKGCIENWNDLNALVPPGGNYVRLQTSPAPTNPDIGGAALTGAGSFGQTVLGIPSAGTPYAMTCGDGLCSHDTTPAEDVTGAGRCVVDCGP